MFKHNLLIAWRTITKNKTFSLINIGGLALGMACSLLIFFWVRDERMKDNFPGRPLYRVVLKELIDNNVNAGYNGPGPLAAELKHSFPEIQYATPVAYGNSKTFQAGDKTLRQTGDYADSDYFKMYPFPLLQGNAATALNSPVSLAISNRMAINFFGSAEAAIGQTIRYQDKKELKVTAVFADLPDNSSRQFDFLVNWPTFLEENAWATDWNTIGPQTTFTLQPKASLAGVRAQLLHLADKYNKDARFRYELDIQLYSEGWLHSDFKNGVATGGRIEYVRLFSLIALFILIIACVNFMNLATARSARRAKEIGVRKVAGSSRLALVHQFIGEALFITALSTLLALALVYIALPYFNQLTDKRIVFPFHSFSFWCQLIAFVLFTGLVAGSYPALFLSSFQPIDVLKNALRSGTRVVLIRKGLVVFQFVLSITLIGVTIIVTRQVNYIQHANLGFDRDNLLYIPFEGELAKNYALFKQQALNVSGITGVSRITEAPTGISFNTAGLDWQGKDPHDNSMFIVAATGYDFVPTLNLQLAQGRDFSRAFASDSAGYLVNESAIRQFHYANPIGMPLALWGKKGRIIGVLKDFHFASLHEKIQPLVLALDDHLDYGTILVRTRGNDMPSILTRLGAICHDLNPRFSFTYHFSDEEYQQQYQNEQVVSRLSDAFAGLAIIISCLGLLGLALFTAEQRAKELGIRKILGASARSVFLLLAGEFIPLVLLSILIATPLAWWSMDQWLHNFAYRISIGWWMFAVAGALAILIALLTVSFQAAKAALVNPVRSLRAE